jgi:hypothetical protein
MFEFTADHFTDLCNTGDVREQISGLSARRKAALRSFWIRLAVGLVITAAAVLSLWEAGWLAVAAIAGVLALVCTSVACWQPLARVSEGLKVPVLEGLAARAGLEYIPADFAPPVYDEARGVLFGAVTSQSFTDLFHGKDAEGRGYAVYEACLQRRVGKNTATIFSGQLYGLQCRAGRQGCTAIVPDKGLFNFFKPARGMERVKIAQDPAFEKKFEVYSTAPHEASSILFDSDLRRLLLGLRESGRVLAYVGPEEVLVAVMGKNRFEAGSMFSARGGEERARAMFEDVCASLKVLNGLKAKLG